jgi:sugar phosphate isomerase/epimerase
MKTHTRRDFLKQGAMAVASTAFLPELSSFKKKKFVGVQLYSVRDDMKKDPLSTLKKVAEMGYKNVEHAYYIDRKFYGWSAKEFKKILDDLGLKMPSGHTVMAKNHWDDAKKDFSDSWKYTVEDAAICGQKYVISPWLDATLRKTHDDLKRYMEVFNKSGELCQKSGMKFGYHNHHFEFAEKFDGVTVFDIILKNTDPNLVAQQLDIGNMYNGGAKALDILTQYPGRFELMHVKDEVEAPAGHAEKYESAVFGTGVIGVKDVIDMGKKMGKTVHFIVEQESYQGKLPLDSIKEDLAIMKKWGY